MKVIIVGASGAIGGAILQQTLQHPSISSIITLTRKPLSVSDSDNPQNKTVENIIIPDFGALENVKEESWETIQDADALVWAMGTYNLNEDVNLKYPLAFQEAFAKRYLAYSRSRRRAQGSKEHKFKFILLGGAFVEPDQSRRLYFLWDQRRMKGLLQTKVLEFADRHSEEGWEAVVIRPGGIMFGGQTWKNRIGGKIFGDGMVIASEVLGASVADLVVNGVEEQVVENGELVKRGKSLICSSDGNYAGS